MQKNIITTILGNQVYSNFRKNNLLEKIQAICPQISNLSSAYLHICESDENLTTDEITRLNQLLDYGTPSEIRRNSDNVIYISPRVGTISPWSSRATDIALHCDIQLNRIERCSMIYLHTEEKLSKETKLSIGNILFDRMTESLFFDEKSTYQLFTHQNPRKLEHIDFLINGIRAISDYSEQCGLALSEDEISYLADHYNKTKSNPTDTELMMFAQANSEHCRHKIFNASWIIDQKEQEHSLFKMIRNTHEVSPQKTIVAYSDNSSVIEGRSINRFYPDTQNNYRPHQEITHFLMKVETHNHPTAISPFAGAATGSGGEIRDEGATGRGSKPKAGLAGFSVSNLNIPEFKQHWENRNLGKPGRIASALQIMIDGPIGAASYNNEFGRPNILGYFRTLEINVEGKFKGYHKPIMLAGGLGNISDGHTTKKQLNVSKADAARTPSGPPPIPR